MLDSRCTEILELRGQNARLKKRVKELEEELNNASEFELAMNNRKLNLN